MTVFRGAQFDETTLSLYDPNNLQNFCWNSVTSTSKKREIAENFMKVGNDPKRAIPVLFLIEVPLNLENSNKWIDIKPYSAIPSEDEVVLPPGSVFELTKVSKDNLDVIEIYLRLIINVEKLAHQGQIMHGAMHSEMANDSSFKLVCLEGGELSDALTHLKGNRLIEELEFCLCKFDEKIEFSPLREIPNLKSLIFISPSTEDNLTHWSGIFNHLEKVSIEKLEISDNKIDNPRLILLSQAIRLPSFKSLTLNFKDSRNIMNEGLYHLGVQGLRNLTQLTSFTKF